MSHIYFKEIESQNRNCLQVRCSLQSRPCIKHDILHVTCCNS